MKHHRLQHSKLLVVHIVLFIPLLLMKPLHPNDTFTVCSFLLYLFQIWSMGRRLEKVDKQNYFDFNMMFFIMLTLCTYVIPFLYLFDLEGLILTSIVYNDKYLNSALLLNSVAVEMYFIGYSKGQSSASTIPGKDEEEFYKLFKKLNKGCRYIAIFSTMFLLALIGIESEKNPDISGPIVTLVVLTIILPLFLAGYSNKYYRDRTYGFLSRNKILIFCAFVIFVRMLMLGDRLTPLSILFGGFFVYSRFVFPIKRYWFLICLFGGGIFMFLLSFTRSSFMYSGSASEMMSSLNQGGKDAMDLSNKTVMLQDVIPINLDLLLGVEYVDRNGYYKPFRFIVEAMAPIPFIPGVMKKLFFGGYTSTAVELTNKNKLHSLTANDSGLGNHIVSDVYMSWGVSGIMVVFFLWGVVIGKTYMRAHLSFRCCIVYGSMMTYAIYFPRATVDTNFRDIAYMFLIYLILKKLFKI